MEKINIAELLKDCPIGMELDCTEYDGFVKFDGFNKDNPYTIRIIVFHDGCVNIHNLTEYGQTSISSYNKCVIFPKGKTTWEGFQRPFKDGDILFYNHKSNNVKYAFIYKRRIDMHYLLQYCGWFSEKPYLSEQFNMKERIPLYENDDIRFATEEEKEKLFKAIKDNGYKWDKKTNTLEKLIKPIFKKGDKVRVKNGVSEPRIIDEVCDRFYTLVPIGSIYFIDQHNWELVPDKIEPIFKVGDRITNGKASITIGYIDDEYYYEIGRNISNRLFIKNQDEWNLVSNKFDISTLKSFESRVLVRDRDNDAWRASFWGCLIKNRYGYNYDTTRGYSKQCIPYEGNEHLLGKTEDCKDFYKTW